MKTLFLNLALLAILASCSASHKSETDAKTADKNQNSLSVDDRQVIQLTTTAKEEILGPIMAKKNFSGLTFVPETRSYFAIINRGERLYEFDERFTLKREIQIMGFDDPEDLVFLKYTAQGPIFAISEETGSLLVGVIGPQNILNAGNMKRIRLFDEDGREFRNGDNKGLEGIGYIPEEGKLLVVKEKNPMKVWSVNVADIEASNSVRLKSYFSLQTEQAISYLVTDLSAIGWNAKERAIVLLSDESSKLLYIDHATQQLTKVMDIRSRQQHEALSFSADYETTIVGSEPYYLFRINKTNTTPSLAY